MSSRARQHLVYGAASFEAPEQRRERIQGTGESRRAPWHKPASVVWLGVVPRSRSRRVRALPRARRAFLHRVDQRDKDVVAAEATGSSVFATNPWLPSNGPAIAVSDGVPDPTGSFHCIIRAKSVESGNRRTAEPSTIACAYRLCR